MNTETFAKEVLTDHTLLLGGCVYIYICVCTTAH